MDTIISSINDKLLDLHLPSFSALPQNLQEYLQKIEIAVKENEDERLAALTNYRKRELNASYISEIADISRGTIYYRKNRFVLERYIEKCRDIQIKSDIFSRILYLSNKVKELEDFIHKLEQRDVSAKKQENEIRQLTEDMRSKDIEIDALNKRNMILISENTELRKSANRHTGSIIKF